MADPAEASHREHLYKLLEHFQVAMIVTHAADGSMVARPMTLARVERDGVIHLITDIHSARFDQIAGDPRVTIVVQSPSQYAAVSGVGELVRDKALIYKLWQERWKEWFPHGKDDPTIAVLVVEPQHAEYWDHAGATGLKFFFQAVKSYMRGKLPREEEEHAEVDLRDKVG